jgi:hypothetical protein
MLLCNYYFVEGTEESDIFRAEWEEMKYKHRDVINHTYQILLNKAEINLLLNGVFKIF